MRLVGTSTDVIVSACASAGAEAVVGTRADAGSAVDDGTFERACGGTIMSVVTHTDIVKR